MDYFVTLGGITIANNVTKNKAIKLGIEKYSSSTPDIGIGKHKIVKGKRVYTLLPLSYFI